MIIDLYIPRLIIKNRLDEVIFNAKMKGYSLNRQQIAAAFTVALILGCSDEAAAYEGTIRIDESLRGNIYSIILALIETLKSCPLPWSYINYWTTHIDSILK